MRCPRCAQLIAEISYECPYCHEQLTFENVVGKDPKRNKTREDIQDHRITYLFMLIPLGGLIYFLYNKDNYPLKASCALKGFIYNTVVLFFICIVLAIALN